MPKRSNQFQNLIKFIEQELAPEGVVVRESVMLKDIDSGEEREVDVLIEGRVGQHEYRFALEYRDHKRKQGKPWLDSLEGKYAHLPVDKVIAVSRSGFTKSAARRAVRAKIQTLSLEEALSADWVDQVATYRMGLVMWHHRLTGARAVYRGKGPKGLSGDDLKASPIGSKEGVAQYHVRGRRPNAESETLGRRPQGGHLRADEGILGGRTREGMGDSSAIRGY